MKRHCCRCAQTCWHAPGLRLCPTHTGTAAVRALCARWIDSYTASRALPGEYAEAGRQVLTALDGTYWCAFAWCPGHDPDEARDDDPCRTRGKP